MDRKHLSVYTQIVAGLNSGSITIEGLIHQLNNGDFEYDPILENIIYEIVSRGW